MEGADRPRAALQRRRERQKDFLAVLNELCNRDKHRMHHPAHLFVVTPRFGYSFESEWEEVEEVVVRETPHQSHISAKLKTSARRSDNSELRLYPQVEVQTASAYITFGRDRIDMGQIKQLIIYVRALLDRFKPAFDPPVGD